MTSCCRPAHCVVAVRETAGHGQSDGLLALVEDFDRLVGDVAAYFDTVRASYPDLTPFLYGESMGGAVALKVSFLRPNAFQGAVLAAPMVKIADEMKPPQCVIDLMVRLSRRYPTPALTPVPVRRSQQRAAYSVQRAARGSPHVCVHASSVCHAAGRSGPGIQIA